MEFFIYATVFRLAIIIAGIVFMYFGYRLFMRGVMPPEGTEIGGQAGEVKLTVKNAAPGTCFALFGLILIGLMVWQGSPEMQITERRGDDVTRDVRLRGPAEGALSLSQTAGFDLMKTLGTDTPLQQQIKGYADQLKDKSLSLGAASDPLLGLASIYLQDGRPDEAIALVRLAYQVRGDDPDTLALMALTEFARGEKDQATSIAQRLQTMHPTHTDLIDKLKQDIFP